MEVKSVVARWLLLTECFEGRHPRRAQRRKHREGRGRSGPFVCVDSRCSASVPMFSTHLGGASSDDVLGLIEIVRAQVFKEFGIELELEVQII